MIWRNGEKETLAGLRASSISRFEVIFCDQDLCQYDDDGGGYCWRNRSAQWRSIELWSVTGALLLLDCKLGGKLNGMVFCIARRIAVEPDCGRLLLI